MRRNNQIGIAGPALLSVGIALLALGFFGGQLGIQSLSLMEGPEHPYLDVGAYTNIAPGSQQSLDAHLYWYGYQNGTSYHWISGVPIKFYLNNVFLGTAVTDVLGSAIYSFKAPTTPGYYEAKAVFEGNSEYPAVEGHVGFVVNEPQNPTPQPNQINTPNGEVSNAMKLIGAGLCFIGIMLCYRGKWK